MDDGIALRSVVVAVVVDSSAEGLGVDPQVADAEVLEDEPHGVEVADEVFGAEAERGGRDGGVHEVARVRRPDGRLGAQVGIPRRRVFDDEDLLERVDVVVERQDVERSDVVPEDVLADLLELGLRADVAGVGAQEKPRPFGTAFFPVHARDVGFGHGFAVVERLLQRDFGAETDRLGPAAAAGQEREFVQVGVGRRRNFVLGIEEVRQRDLAVGVARFEERHGTHEHPRDAPRAGVRDFGGVGGHGGAGQDELAEIVPLVHLESHCVPKLGRQLPFVDQPRGFALEQPGGVGVGQLEVLALLRGGLHIEDAFGDLLGRGGLSAPFRPLHEDGALRFKLLLEDLVGIALSVLHALNLTQNRDFGAFLLETLADFH